MAKVYAILFTILLVCVGCEWQLRPNDADADSVQVSIERYDRIEMLYLTTGDFSALQQMNTSYPMQTRMLIEDMLHIGKANDPDINARLLHFFQDSTLQQMLSCVQQQYADLDDLNEQLTTAFRRLKEELPSLEVPLVYAQVGSFDQSIVVGDNLLGISLDKYLGTDYPFYLDNYTDRQRRMMTREMIVPDCLGFYLLSLYPVPLRDELTQRERDAHMGRIQWVVNRVTDRKIFENDHVRQTEQLMKRNRKMTIHGLLLGADFGADLGAD